MIFIMIVVTIIGIFMAINYLLIYTLGEFQALQLIVLAALGAVD